MIVFRSSGKLAVAMLAVGLCVGCTLPAQRPGNDILTPLVPRAAVQPSDADLISRDLIRATLLSRSDEAEAELEEMEALAEGGGLDAEVAEERLTLSFDLVATTVDHPREYREKCKKLRYRFGLNPRLKERMKECVDDDPLRLANRRVWDVRESIFADTYNAIAEPLSRSLLSGGALTPYYLAVSAANYLAKMNERDPFPVQYRQALAHREEFLEQHPNSPEAPRVKRQVERARKKFNRVEAKRMTFAARQSFEAGQVRYAFYLAKRAQIRDPSYEDAALVGEQARLAILHQHEERARSMSADPPLDETPSEEVVHFTAAMLDPGAEIDAEARKLLEVDADSAHHDAARYMIATLWHEEGREDASWNALRKLAGRGPEKSPIARHAWSLIEDRAQNPYGSFRETQQRQTWEKFRWQTMAHFYNGPRFRRLPKVIAWAMDLPAAVNTVAMTPVRMILGNQGPSPDFDRATSSAAYNYLEHYPGGAHTREVATWLYDYQMKSQNWSAALRLADYLDTDPIDRSELVEKAARQQIMSASRTTRRDQRASMLRHTAREYPDSVAGHHAGIAVREQLLDASEQKIRMTKGFLLENPQVSGRYALGIAPELLDDSNVNGELHPRGVTFLGGRDMEFAFIAPSGDEDDEPIEKRRTISEERLARVVSQLEHVTHRNMRVDPDDEVGADPQRDHFFEKARLGLVDDVDRRSTAQSTYVYQSMRERYGMVRGRDSILPFDIVVRGDLRDLGISAFPRWRKPRLTPDAYLYR